MEALEALLNFYIKKYITDDAGHPVIKKGMFYGCIITEYKEQREEIRIYYYPDLKQYGFFKYKNKELIIDQCIKKESASNNSELRIKDLYKHNYIKKQKEGQQQIISDRPERELPYTLNGYRLR